VPVVVPVAVVLVAVVLVVVTGPMLPRQQQAVNEGGRHEDNPSPRCGRV